MSTSSSAQVQSPSKPEETSASRAFTQIDLETQRRIAKEIEEKDNAFATKVDTFGAGDEHKDLFAAYSLDPKHAGARDESNDDYVFEVRHTTSLISVRA